MQSESEEVLLIKGWVIKKTERCSSHEGSLEKVSEIVSRISSQSGAKEGQKSVCKANCPNVFSLTIGNASGSLQASILQF